MLYDIENFHYRLITVVDARDRDEARRKAWKLIFKKAPELMPYFRKNDFMVMLRNDSCWGRADFYGVG
jgi:hypothetical protein